MNRLRKLTNELRVIWNEDVLYWIENWYFWKFTYPKHYKDKNCLRCGRSFNGCNCIDGQAMHN